MLLLIAMILMFVSITTSIYGPRSWLKISAVSAFLSGITAGMAWPGDTDDRLLAGLCLGPFGLLFIVGSGLLVRRYRMKGS
jgi:hypothetical protein